AARCAPGLGLPGLAGRLWAVRPCCRRVRGQRTSNPPLTQARSRSMGALAGTLGGRAVVNGTGVIARAHATSPTSAARRAITVRGGWDGLVGCVAQFPSAGQGLRPLAERRDPDRERDR